MDMALRLTLTAFLVSLGTICMSIPNAMASNTGTWPYDFGSFPYGVWEYRSTHYFNGGYPARQYGYYEYAYPYGTPYGYPQTYYYPYYVPRYRR